MYKDQSTGRRFLKLLLNWNCKILGVNKLDTYTRAERT